MRPRPASSSKKLAPMNDIVIRDLDETTLQRLRLDALRRGRSLEEHVRHILEERSPLVAGEFQSRSELREEIRRIRDMTPAGADNAPCSEDIVRQMRDER